jgi:pyruvate dehydrogenase E1 component alpha subunit
MATDPIPRCRYRLQERGVPRAALDAIDASEAEAIAEAARAAIAAPWPEPSAAFTDIQTAGAFS